MNKWGYICTLINQQRIIGYAVATNKDAVYRSCTTKI